MTPASTRAPEASYRYTDEHGEPLFTVHRWPGKRFSQQPPDGRAGAGAMDGVRLVLYRLPRLLAAGGAGDAVYFVEGEKDVHAAEAAGATATCNPGGGGRGKWRADYAEYFRGVSTIVIVADRDEPGTEHAREVTTSLERVAPCITVQAAIGKDLADHLAAGLPLDELVPFKLPPRPPEPEPPKPRTRRPLAPDATHEALKAIDTAAYFWLLTGRELDSRGFALCPIHEERTPSFHAFAGNRWQCFGCSRQGDVFDLAAALWGYTRFQDVRARLVEIVLGGGRSV